jgi:O-antigen/teichoic acid export membrane protein
MILAAFRNAWHPFAFSIMGREGSEAVYGRALTLFAIAAGTITLCGSLFSPEGLLVVNAITHKNWSGAAPSVGPLAMGALFSMMYFIMQTGAYIVRRTGTIATTMGAAALVTVLLNFMLIPRFGILGAAFATALGQLAALVIMYKMAQRLAPIPYQTGKLTLAVSAIALTVLAASYFQSNLLWKDLLLKFMLLAFYCVTLLAARVFTVHDLALLWKSDWRSLKSREPRS